ncbi:MAG: SAM-dependent methyltransferase [Deltaproteobacteria bacterium]|nr:SAM-dependent methyltransferase [Deltaproteobacteria bacterium]
MARGSKGPARKAVQGKAVAAELDPGQSKALLQSLHLLDRNGNLQADTRRKLKQVNHLIRLLAPALEDAFERHEEPLFLDAGAGNVYLGFVLYELYFQPRGRGRVLAVEPRPELVAQARERAAKLGFERLEVQEGTLAEVELPERLHLVGALHACDTATDEALLRALAARADHVALVPCCQAEVARQLGELAKEEASPLFARPLHRREFGAHLTNVIRSLVLEARGYKVTVTELTGWEHSLKNELILARRIHDRNPGARRRLEALLEQYPVRPAALAALEPQTAG